MRSILITYSFIFGGWVGSLGAINTDSHQVYILSLPAFRWFRVPSSTASRFAHSCQVVGKRQMLNIGGADPTNTVVGAHQDPYTYGLGVFDMVIWEWTSGYTSNAEAYQSSTQVKQYYSQKYCFKPRKSSPVMLTLAAALNIPPNGINLDSRL